MRKTILGTVAILAISGAAQAADYQRPVLKAPPLAPAPVLSWTGFYAGLNGGYSFGQARSTAFSGTAAEVDVSKRVDGWLGGVQAGYNWQVSTNWLLGVEADFQITGERAGIGVNGGSTRVTVPGGDFNLVTSLAAANSYSMPWFGTFRGRLGLVADPAILLYATGGLAVADVKYSTQNYLTAQLFGPGATGTIPAGPAVTVAGTEFSGKQTRVGWTVGGGVEYKLTRNWSGKLEYLYMDLGRSSYFAGIAGTQTDVRFRDHIARAGINYAF
jgi:outer membrane immunogenic protein